MSKYGRYGYKRATALLNQDGWKINYKGVLGFGEKKANCGLAMETVFPIDQNIRIMSGRMVLSMKEKMAF